MRVSLACVLHGERSLRSRRDELPVSLLRGVNGAAEVSGHTRPETPDYIELRVGAQNTVLFPGGLPFHQRHGSRMLDVILVSPGETAQTFDLALGVDREHPMQTGVRPGQRPRR